MAARIRTLLERYASRVADAIRTEPGEPSSTAKVAVRMYLRRLARLMPRVYSDAVAAMHSNRSRIAPSEVIERETVESIVAGADEYFRQMIDAGGASFLKRKPFHDLAESPAVLFRLGQLLDGAQLAPGLSVLEYGGGTGWLSAVLWQMGCRVTCVDASEIALEMAREAFEECREVAVLPALPAQAVTTDGHTLPLSGESVDRIICFDAFHHVPNQREVLHEFHRVLKTGGIACFSEPGRYHSLTPMSQQEMAQYRVLENDIVLEQIWDIAKSCGFTDIRIRPLLDRSYLVGVDEYQSLIKRGRLRLSGQEALLNGTLSTSIFFLYKGAFVPDSRFASRLSGHISTSRTALETSLHEPVNIVVRCLNTGRATWLTSDAHDGVGRVNVAVQLCDAQGHLIDRNWRRAPMSHDVTPGSSIDVTCALIFPHRGQFTLRFDLVSEHVAWFQAGCDPTLLSITVR